MAAKKNNKKDETISAEITNTSRGIKTNIDNEEEIEDKAMKDYLENYNGDSNSDLGMIADEAEGIQVVTTYDAEGNVIDAYANSVSDKEDNESEEDEEEIPLSKFIDHTLLKADATPDEIMQLCADAKKYDFAAVCVNSSWVRLAAELLRGSDVRVASTVGFPLGAMLPEAKAFEAQCAIENGAAEIDMVINIGALKARDYRMVAKDISLVADAAHEGGADLKVIIETCLLTREEKIIACLLAKNADADFVKTSTGFSTAGATVEDVKLMRKVVGPDMGVKAAGGIRTLEDAEKMIEAGADRIGTSHGVDIVKGK